MIKIKNKNGKVIKLIQEANLQEADLWGADLWGADLWGANFDFSVLPLH